MGLILDASVVIRAERRGLSIEELIVNIESVVGDSDVAFSAVCLTEFVHGIYRATTLPIRASRERFLSDLLRIMPVIPYSQETALLAGRIDGEQQASGVTIPFADLLIGATALSIGFSVLTSNARHFRLIPGLTVVPF
jgi:predicted nucleic acid-binding protein